LAILLFLLKLEPSLPSIEKEKKTFIKSYLYKLPRQKIEEHFQKEVVGTKYVKSDFIKPTLAKKSEVVKPEKSEIIEKKINVSKDIKKAISSASEIDIAMPAKVQKNTVNFSAYGSLERLKLSINNKIMAENSTKPRYFKAGPVINATSEPVPHSVTKTEIDSVLEGAKRMLLTATYYGGTTVFKDEDGVCTTVTDVSFLSTSPMKRVSRSRCGKSKFDKNFSLHMKDVIKKLGK